MTGQFVAISREQAEAIIAAFRAEAAAAQTDQEVEAVARRLEAWVRKMRALQWEPYVWQRPHLHPPGWISRRVPGKDVCDDRCALLPDAPIPTHGAWLQRSGRGCVAGHTLIYLPIEDRHERIDRLAAAGQHVTVLALTDDGPVGALTDGAPFLRGHDHLWEVTTADGARVTVTAQHRFLTPQGWQRLARVHAGHWLAAGAPAPPALDAASQPASHEDAQHSMGTSADSRFDCPKCRRSGDLQPPSPQDACLASVPPQDGAAARIRDGSLAGVPDAGSGCIHACPRYSHQTRTHSYLAALSAAAWEYPGEPSHAGSPPHHAQDAAPFQRTSNLLPTTFVTAPSRTTGPGSLPPQHASHSQVAAVPQHHQEVAESFEVTFPSALQEPSTEHQHDASQSIQDRQGTASAYPQPTSWVQVTAIAYAGFGPFYDLTVPGPENYAAEGLWNHNCGKTEGAAHYLNRHAESAACDTRVPGGHRFTIIAPTQADAVSSCVEGVSGLKAINPGIIISTGKEGTVIRWPNGVLGKICGAYNPKDVDRVRAWSNVCAWWVEEAAAMPMLGGLAVDQPELPQGVMDQAPFTLRLGSNPHMVITTTPKNRPEVIKLLTISGPITWGRTEDAHRLEAPVRESLETLYRGSTIGRQELDGELIADTPGALWVSDRPAMVDGQPNPDERPGIGNDRLTIADVGWISHPRPEGLQGDGSSEPRRPASETPVIVNRVVISVDPPGGRTECGIIVCGASGQHGYPLADLSGAFPPDTWARIVLEAYYDFGAEGLAVEKTYGGNMVTEVIGARAEILGIPAPPIFAMPTKVGKRLRAEPVQALYQQHRIHHVGNLDGLETEQRTWVPDQTTDSPNRIDALVHGMNFLLISARPGSVSNPASMPAVTRMPTTFSNTGTGQRRR